MRHLRSIVADEFNVCDDSHFIRIFLSSTTITALLGLITGTQGKSTLKNQGREGWVTVRRFKVDQIPILDCLLG